MSSSRTLTIVLLRHELRRGLTSPIVLATLALLLVAGIWGAANVARLHARQAADLARMANAEANWYADIRGRATRYAQPSPTPVPYWQDPTGASGFSRYFLRRSAAKPHLPLSVLAVGQSDLQPFAMPLRLETLFGGDYVYDYAPPRALATGLFDLSFVLALVLPLCVGAATAVVGAQERDQDILPSVAAHAISARHWWSIRLAALAMIFVPGVAVIVGIVLATAGAPILAAWPETIAVMALVSTHTLGWLSVAGWCLIRGYGAVSTMSLIASLWFVLTLAVPLTGSLAMHSAVHRPSPVADVNEYRRTMDEVQREAGTIIASRLRAYFGSDAASANPMSLDYATRLILITQEMEERLAAQETRRREYSAASATISDVLSWLSPQMAFYTALSDLAGTGTRRHQTFLMAVRSFQLELRAFMYPRVLEQARTTAQKACSSCPGRLTFVDYEAIPRFTMPETSSGDRAWAGLRTAAWLGLLAVSVIVFGIAQRSTWALALSP